MWRARWGWRDVRLALTRGRALIASLDLLDAAGLPVAPLRDERQRPVCELSDGTRVAVLRPSDVPTYVESGAADAGLAAKEWLLERQPDLYELLDVRAAPRRLVYATRADDGAARQRRLGRLRVATAFPAVAAGYFAGTGRQVEIVPLSEDVELAPALGLADAVIVPASTGARLRAAGLVERQLVAACSLRLVVNRAAHALLSDEIEAFAARLREVVEER